MIIKSTFKAITAFGGALNILYVVFAENKHHQNDKRGRWSCLEDMLTLHELESKTLKEIYTYARELKIPTTAR